MTGRRLTLDEQLCFALYAATNAVTRAYRPLLKRIGLTYTQYLVMLVLWQHGTQPMHAIADRLELPPNAISPLVERLEQAGFLQRRRDPVDRRVVYVVLTEAGALLEDAAAETQAKVACATRLAPDELARLRSELRDLARHLGAPEQAADVSDDALVA